MALQTTSIRVDEDILYQVKKIALDEKKTQTEIIKEFLVDGINKRKSNE